MGTNNPLVVNNPLILPAMSLGEGLGVISWPTPKFHDPGGHSFPGRGGILLGPIL